MILVAQFDFAEVLSLEGNPTEGIFQLFDSATEWMNADPKDYRILFRLDPTTEAQTDFGFLTLLLQINTETEWGDSGVANMFICPEALRAKQYDAAWSTLDCC